MDNQAKGKKTLNFANISIFAWLAALCGLAYFGYVVFTHDVLTGTSRYIAVSAGALLTVIALVWTLKKKNLGATLLNLVLACALCFAGIFIPSMQQQQENIFKEPAKTDVSYVNFYVRNDGSHPSDDLADYGDAVFIVQNQFDTANEYTAVTEASSQLGKEIATSEYETVMEALEAFYQGKGDVLILNQAFAAKIRTLDRYADFDRDTKIIYTCTIGEEKVDEEPVQEEKQPFAVLITGSDTRDSALTIVTRTDVDMIMAVNPNTKQILFVSIPRDYYIYNPGLEGMDKLTHLGNLGILNTVDGINQHFNLSMDSYLCTNFTHFKQMIDGLGGITIDNPYAFTSGSFSFPEGSISLNGEQALSFARERHNLPNGDFDRSKHETLIMQGMMQKIQTLVQDGQKSSVLKTLSSNFLTNMNFNDLYNLYASSSDVDAEWEYIRYGLDGYGTYAGTVSMGWDTMLYVCQPIDAQVTFVNQVVNQLLNGERIGQDVMPGQEGATYVEEEQQ